MIDRRDLIGATAAAALLTSASATAAETGAELDGQGAIHLGPRVIPVPKSISPRAQTMLAMARSNPGPTPALDDKAGWKAFVARSNAALAAGLKPVATAAPARSKAVEIAGVPVFVAEPDTILAQNRGKAILYFHGGGLVLGSGECTHYFTIMEAVARGCKVFGVDYRNPPDHPFPAALNDCVTVYRELINTHRPDDLVITGASGGGNLAVAAPLKIRALGLPLPAAIGLFTPELDLTESGDTFQTNRDIDVVLRHGLPEFNALYADGRDLSDPYLSPLFGDFTNGFPPTFIQTGTRDLFLSNSVRLHQALLQAGVDAELYVGEAMPHGGFDGATPEDRDMRAAFLRFLAKRSGATGAKIERARGRIGAC
jgi:monoterpene epsilon-lactone hydrolase